MDNLSPEQFDIINMWFLHLYSVEGTTMRYYKRWPAIMPTLPLYLIRYSL